MGGLRVDMCETGLQPVSPHEGMEPARTQKIGSVRAQREQWASTKPTWWAYYLAK